MTAITVTTRTLGDGVTTVLPPSRPKRGLRGAFMNIPYVGPLLSGAAVEPPASVLHNSTSAAGGVEDTDGYRELDEYSVDGNTGGLTGGPSTSVSRPTGRTAYIGAGVPGGSSVRTEAAGPQTNKGPIDPTGRAVSTGKDRFGRTKGTPNSGAGIKDYDYTNFDGRSTLDGDGGRALGGGGRGTTTDGVNVTQYQSRPTVGASANPAASTVGVVAGGSSVVQVDIHADDITGGSAGLAGYQVALFERDTGDTDEDGPCIGVFDCDGGTDITTLTTLSGARTIVVYARKRYKVTNGGATTYGYGPRSARVTLAVT